MPVIIAAHVDGTSEANKDEQIEALTDDIFAALNADTTRGGNASHTTVIDDENDNGDPDTVDHTGVSGTLIVRCEVVYFRTTGAS